jgi:hypothetical protein
MLIDESADDISISFCCQQLANRGRPNAGCRAFSPKLVSARTGASLLTQHHMVSDKYPTTDRLDDVHSRSFCQTLTAIDIPISAKPVDGDLF